MRSDPGSGRSNEVRRYDIDVYDDAGLPVLTISGFTTRRIRDAEATIARSRAHHRHHVLEWVPAPTDGSFQASARAGERIVLVELDDLTHPTESIYRALIDDGHEVTRVAVPMASPGHGSATAHDAIQLRLADLHVPAVDHLVVHLPTAGGDEQTDYGDPIVAAEAAQFGCDVLHALVRAFADKHQLPQRLSVVASDAAPGSGRTALAGSHAAAFAVAQAITLEHNLDLLCLATDRDSLRQSGARLGQDRWARVVLIKAGRMYVQQLRPYAASGERADNEHQSFLITGGLGGLGLASALHFARTRPLARIALLGRRELPPRTTWPQHARTESEARPLFLDLLELERLTGDLRTLCADVSDLPAMERVVATLREAWGGIDCVIHAAGIAGDGFLVRKSERDFRRTMAPKVRGTLVLDHALRLAPPKIMILFSSTVTVFGAPGQSDYAAANRFMEEYADSRSGRGLPTVAIGWSDWLERGMAADHGVEPDSGFFRSLRPSDALDSLDLLAEGTPGTGCSVFVGEVNLERFRKTDLGEWQTFLANSPIQLSGELASSIEAILGGDKGSREHASDTGRRAVRLTGRASGTYTHLETQLARLWATELDLEEINISASTFDLGGDSLTALRIAAGIEKTTGLRISMLDLLRYETVEELAQEIGRASASNREAGKAT